MNTRIIPALLGTLLFSGGAVSRAEHLSGGYGPLPGREPFRLQGGI